MSEELAKLLDLKTAWKRVRTDIANRVFIRHPYAVELIESDLEGWLASLLDAIRKGLYKPSPMFVCDVPKGNGLIRPGSHLSYSDRLVYAACVGASFVPLHKKLIWSQGTIDFSYRLAVDPANPEWIRDRFTGWQEFREKSVALVHKGASYVIVADISAFYENIDISILLSDLRETRAPEEAIKQLSVCLNKWAQVPGRGIPQGQTPSDILAKLYLNNIDLNLKSMGYVHLRYVDDVRIFCSTLVDAKKAMVDLSRLLRKRSLNLQSAKSEILRADVAREKFEEVTAVLTSVRSRFIAEVVKQSGYFDPYIDLSEADAILEQNEDETSIEVIQQTYQAYFIDNSDEFNPTLFRFLLRRLGKQADIFAAAHSLSLLEPHPEETENILHYLSAVSPVEQWEAEITDLLRSGHIVYQYQCYKILEWFAEHSVSPSNELTDVIRTIAFDPSSQRYLRTAARAFLARFGLSSDLERIADSYDETTDHSEQVEIICSLRRLEKGRRNVFLGRVQADGEMHSRAAKWSRPQVAKYLRKQSERDRLLKSWGAPFGI